MHGPRRPRTDRPASGRGTAANPAGRFASERVVPVDDGWTPSDAPAPPIRTQLTPERSRSIITTNDSPDVPFSRSINPYKGCEHGCVYCFARPTHAYLDLSPGLDFESRIVYKPDAARLLERALRKPGYRPEPIALGANTDPYQPAERELRITRALLEVLAAYAHPVGVVTKSNLILRDTDLLADLARRGLAHALISITTLDRDLARRLEPRAPTPDRRLDAVRALAGAGVPVGVLVSPIIPAINDGEIEAILEAAAAAGARAAGTILVRLPHELKDLFEGWLDDHYPLRKPRVLARIRDARGGRLYDSRWGTRMRGVGPYADLLRRRFDVAARRLGLDRELPPLDAGQFRVPPRAGDQLALFDG